MSRHGRGVATALISLYVAFGAVTLAVALIGPYLATSVDSPLLAAALGVSTPVIAGLLYRRGIVVLDLALDYVAGVRVPPPYY